MTASRWSLSVVLSLVVALGLTLIIAASNEGFIDGTWGRRLAALAVLLAGEILLFTWFARAPTVGALIRRFRLCVVTEFLVFGVLGVLMAADSLYRLFD